MATVKVVTDSTADLPVQLAKDLGITIVPLYVRFGHESYRDHVDIGPDQFYSRLLGGGVHPSTCQPSPEDFAAAYEGLCRDGSSIISVHISGRLSGTVSSAAQAAKRFPECAIQIVDSRLVSMGLGLAAMIAGREAAAGLELEEVAARTRDAVTRIRMLGYFETLKYLALGGRIGRAAALLGSVLSVKPILTVRDGELLPAGRVRSREQGMDRLFDYVKSSRSVDQVAVVYSTTPELAETLAGRIATIVDRERIVVSRLGPVLGVHGGPGTLFVAVSERG